MCFSCLKPRNICRSRRCTNVAGVPEVLKCAVCASWAVSKWMAPFSIFFCKWKEHRDSRAPLAELKRELEKYIGKLGTTIVDSSIQFAVKFMFKTLDTKESSESFLVLCKEDNVCSMSSESFIYLMRNHRIWNSDCLTFSEANAHLMDRQLAEKKKLQLISSKSTALGVIGGGSIMTE